MGTLADDPPVRLRPENEGVQLTPFGAVPLGEAHIDTGMMGSAPPLVPATDFGFLHQARVAEHVSGALPPSRMMSIDGHPGVQVRGYGSPREVVKAARARIKELRAFMREAAKAKKELTELERLVAAAKGKQLAPVRDIRRSTG